MFWNYQRLLDLSISLLGLSILSLWALWGSQKEIKRLKASLCPRRKDRGQKEKPSHNLILVNARKAANQFDRDMALMRFKEQIGEVKDTEDVYGYWGKEGR